FEYSRGDVRIRLKKPSASAGAAPMGFRVSEPIAAANASAPAVSEAASPAPAATEVRAPSEDLHVVKSPIVGTYYESPSPGAESFVKLGQIVDTGQTLCIVEAMKLMNEIESDASCEIVRIFVENGQPVEYGQPLFGIRPGRKK